MIVFVLVSIDVGLNDAYCFLIPVMSGEGCEIGEEERQLEFVFVL